MVIATLAILFTLLVSAMMFLSYRDLKQNE